MRELIGRDSVPRQVTHGVLQWERGGDSEGGGGRAEDGAGQEGGDDGVHGRGHRVEGHRGHHARVSHLRASTGHRSCGAVEGRGISIVLGYPFILIFLSRRLTQVKAIMCVF